MKTQAEVRRAFWSRWNDCHAAPSKYEGRRQNDCPADIRMAFVDFVDSLAKDGTISEKLADRVTL